MAGIDEIVAALDRRLSELGQEIEQLEAARRALLDARAPHLLARGEPIPTIPAGTPITMRRDVLALRLDE